MKLTMDSLFNMVIADCEQKGNRSVKNIRAQITLHLKPYFADKFADEIGNQDIRDYITHRQKGGAKPGTINRELSTLVRGYHIAIDDELLMRRPKIRMLPENNAREGIITAEQYAKILASITPRYRPLIVFGYHKPWRSGEIRSILCENVELIQNGVFTITLRKDDSKNKEPRTIIVVEGELFDTIAAAMERSRQIESKWLFCEADGTRIANATFYQHWKRAFAVAGVPSHYVFHTLRHTSNTNHLNATKDTKFVMENTGHKSDEMLRRYHHIDLDSHIAKTREVEAYLSSHANQRGSVPVTSKTRPSKEDEQQVDDNSDADSKVWKTKGFWGRLRSVVVKLGMGGK